MRLKRTGFREWEVYRGAELLGRVWRTDTGLWDFVRARGGFGGNYPTRARAVGTLSKHCASKQERDQ